MKDKILITISNHANFGIAKCIQDNYDCDLFAFYDINFPEKNFFEKQKLINFQKVWYYIDNISFKELNEPDIGYLKLFEKKYNINLWKVAFGERSFYKYNQYYQFSENEILSILQKECKLFEHILDSTKPDFLIMDNQSAHHNHLFEEMCKQTNIIVLKLAPVRLGYRSMIVDSSKRTSNNKISSENSSTKRKLTSTKEIQELLKKFDYPKQIDDFFETQKKVSRLRQYANIIKFFFQRRHKIYEKHYSYYGRTKLSEFKTMVAVANQKRDIWNFINHHSISNVNDYKPFIYFPLHSEPEKALLIDAPFYSDQIEVINNIAKSLPIGYTLLVKDHPELKFLGGRSISFYEKIITLPNVKLIHSKTPRDEILKNCSLVITIAGTSGFEAGFFNKPTIVFTDTDYSHLSSVYRIKSIEELPQVIRTSLQMKIDSTDLINYIEKIYENSFEYDELGLKTDILNRFFVRGFELLPIEITEKGMRSFLEDHKSTFKLLASEYLKKIQQCKRVKL